MGVHRCSTAEEYAFPIAGMLLGFLLSSNTGKCEFSRLLY